MKAFLLVTLLLGSLPAAAPRVTAATDNGYARQIVGRWLDRKIIHYHANGTWGLQKTDDGPVETRGMRWRVDGDRLLRTSPSGVFVERIISLDREKLVTETATGERLVATRYRPMSRHGGSKGRRAR